MDVKVGKVYRHFKGNLYIVEGIATNSETLEKMVVYRALYGDCALYVKEYDNFVEKLDKNRYPHISQEYRFKHVEITSNIEEE